MPLTSAIVSTRWSSLRGGAIGKQEEDRLGPEHAEHRGPAVAVVAGIAPAEQSASASTTVRPTLSVRVGEVQHRDQPALRQEHARCSRGSTWIPSRSSSATIRVGVLRAARCSPSPARASRRTSRYTA